MYKICINTKLKGYVTLTFLNFVPDFIGLNETKKLYKIYLNSKWKGPSTKAQSLNNSILNFRLSKEIKCISLRTLFDKKSLLNDFFLNVWFLNYKIIPFWFQCSNNPDPFSSLGDITFEFEVLWPFVSICMHSFLQTFCKALILLRHKGLLRPMDLSALFFNLLRCKDKALRKFLQEHIINDTKNINAKHKDARLNKVIRYYLTLILN